MLNSYAVYKIEIHTKVGINVAHEPINNVGFTQPVKDHVCDNNHVNNLNGHNANRDQDI